MNIVSQLAPKARRATVVLAATALLGGVASTAQAAAPTGKPFGNFERATAVTGGVEVKGWTIDPDTTDAINVRYTVDGSTATTRLASDVRWDVASAFPGYGEKHGFRETIATSSGTHEVCAIALNTGRGKDRVLHCYDVTVARGGGSPFGSFERATGGTEELEVEGWAVDPDTSAPIKVRISVGGATSEVDANLTRNDVEAAFPGSGTQHGFLATVPATAGTHQVCATAIDVGVGSDYELGCYDVTVAGGGGSPFGSFERATGQAGAVEVKGWTVDPDTSAPIKVRISVGGATSEVDANLTRNDVEAAFPGSGTQHGFLATVPATAGTHQVCATAIDVGVGSDYELGCYNVTVSQPASSGTTTPASTTNARPDSSNTGVPSGTQLTRHNGDLVITTAGTVIDGLDIYGTVSVRADNVVIRNSRVRGRAATYNTPLVSMNKGNTNLQISDTEIAPDAPSPYLYGIMGWEFTLERVNIHHVVDSAHIYGPNVTIRASWLHDNVHYENDPNFGGTPTHDDGVQIQKGSNIRIIGSRVEGAYNAAVQITQDQGRTSEVSFTGNWIDGGGCSINVSDKGLGPVTGLVATDNTFGRDTRHYNCAMITPSSSPIDAVGNVFTDGEVAAVRAGD